MRQVADGRRPGLRQKMPDACGETPTETNIAPVAFDRNHNSVVCLPLLSESQRLIWVHSNQIDLQLDGAAELDKAFDRFPYLTQKQTVALAQRCSLHPDQVKVWFMVQRLRYGISWDYKDIQDVRRKFTSSQGKDQEELQNRMGEEVQENRGEKEKQKREVKESGGRKAGKVKEEQSANEGRMMGENVRASKLSERKMKQQQEVNKEKDRKIETVEEVKRNTQKKRKKMAVAGKMGKKRMKQDDDGIMERVWQKSNLSETKLSTKEKRKAKANERLMPGQEWPANKSSVDPHVIETCSFPTGIHCSKRQHQLAMMKAAFSSCQYPTADDYDRMALLIGIPRHMLVQWFGDMRYYVKKGRPRWMNQVQHSQALANINYRQYLNKLAKAERGQQKSNLEEEV
ncbi:zinc fingers and homeoboxes protein 1-like protein [Lates japonicus]|uniref:Zinc fingers and homeoboxes protein 1-like protein n=1 Tax=Lates japonicus TaxID=270547 RepID=A0AAD3MGM1_LATJO|nr:zinc fingers and homeoboxes protein 1-like protein [Lates japonicus]